MSNSSAKACRDFFHNRLRLLLLPPPSAEINGLLARGNRADPIVFGTGFAHQKNLFISACYLRVLLIHGNKAVRMAGDARARTSHEAGTDH
jgi:hypothetical protein